MPSFFDRALHQRSRPVIVRARRHGANFFAAALASAADLAQPVNLVPHPLNRVQLRRWRGG